MFLGRLIGWLATPQNMATIIITCKTFSTDSLSSSTFSIGSPPLSGVVFSALHLLIYWSSSSLADNLSASGDYVVLHACTTIKHQKPSQLWVPAPSTNSLRHLFLLKEVINNNLRVSNIRVSNRTLIYNVCFKSALTWPSRHNRHRYLCRFYRSRKVVGLTLIGTSLVWKLGCRGS